MTDIKPTAPDEEAAPDRASAEAVLRHLYSEAPLNDTMTGRAWVTEPIAAHFGVPPGAPLPEPKPVQWVSGELSVARRDDGSIEGWFAGKHRESGVAATGRAWEYHRVRIPIRKPEPEPPIVAEVQEAP